MAELKLAFSDSLIGISGTSKVWQFCENYLDLGVGDRFVATPTGTLGCHKIKFARDQKRNVLMTCLKIISYVFITLPILAVIFREYYRNYNSLYITTTKKRIESSCKENFYINPQVIKISSPKCCAEKKFPLNLLDKIKMSASKVIDRRDLYELEDIDSVKWMATLNVGDQTIKRDYIFQPKLKVSFTPQFFQNALNVAINDLSNALLNKTKNITGKWMMLLKSRAFDGQLITVFREHDQYGDITGESAVMPLKELDKSRLSSLFQEMGRMNQEHFDADMNFV